MTVGVRLGMHCRTVLITGCVLEVQAEAHFYPSGAVGAVGGRVAGCDYAEGGGAGETRRRIVEVLVVEDVEEIR